MWPTASRTQYDGTMKLKAHLCRWDGLLWAFAGLAWLTAVIVIGSSPKLPQGYVFVPLVLLGITWAIYRLLRSRPFGLAIAACAAPMLALVAIGVAFWFSTR